MDSIISINNVRSIYSLTGWKLQRLGSAKLNNSAMLNKRSASCNLFTLHCEWCHRTIGNWNFISEEDSEPQLKRQRTSENGENALQLLEAFGQHQKFCPWIYSIDGETSAWEQILDFYSSSTNETTMSLQVRSYLLSLHCFNHFSFQAEEGFKKLVMALN